MDRLNGLVDVPLDAVGELVGAADEIEGVPAEHIRFADGTGQREDSIVGFGDVRVGVLQVLLALATGQGVRGMDVCVPPSALARNARTAEEHICDRAEEGCQHDEYDPGEPRIAGAAASQQNDRHQKEDQPDVGNEQKCGSDPVHVNMVVGSGPLCKSAAYEMRCVPQVQRATVVLIDATGGVEPLVEPDQLPFGERFKRDLLPGG